MSRAKVIVDIPKIDVILEGEVKESGNGCSVGVLKKYIGRKAKILIFKEGV